MGPAGKTLTTSQSHCIGGIVGYIDKKVLGEKHIYQHPTAKYTYDSSGFDPEGLFGCIFTVVQSFFNGTVMVHQSNEHMHAPAPLTSRWQALHFYISSHRKLFLEALVIKSFDLLLPIAQRFISKVRKLLFKESSTTNVCNSVSSETDI
uniref:Uncharacterized protein n=1 Tax=Megaselia scalaris TaxID=36166 RepID=T1GDR4_MEGSC